MELSEKACATWLVNKEPIERKEIIIEKKVIDEKEVKKVKDEINLSHTEIITKLEYLYQLHPTKETYDNIVTMSMFNNN